MKISLSKAIKPIVVFDLTMAISRSPSYEPIRLLGSSYRWLQNSSGRTTAPRSTHRSEPENAVKILSAWANLPPAFKFS
jgi:hypothetical protein